MSHLGKLGSFIEAFIDAGLALLYEVLQTIRISLASFAIPALATTIQIPTLSDTLKDLEVAACDLFAMAASLLPLTFSCSNQSPNGTAQFIMFLSLNN